MSATVDTSRQVIENTVNGDLHPNQILTCGKYVLRQPPRNATTGQGYEATDRLFTRSFLGAENGGRTRDSAWEGAGEAYAVQRFSMISNN